MDATRLLILSLAAYRLASLVAVDNGPFAMFARFRRYSGVKANLYSGLRDTSLPVTWAKFFYSLLALFWKNLADAIHCPYCVGVWFAAACLLIELHGSRVGNLFLLWLAISGAQALAQELANK